MSSLLPTVCVLNSFNGSRSERWYLLVWSIFALLCLGASPVNAQSDQLKLGLGPGPVTIPIPELLGRETLFDAFHKTVPLLPAVFLAAPLPFDSSVALLDSDGKVSDRVFLHIVPHQIFHAGGPSFTDCANAEAGINNVCITVRFGSDTPEATLPGPSAGEPAIPEIGDPTHVPAGGFLDVTPELYGQVFGGALPFRIFVDSDPDPVGTSIGNTVSYDATNSRLLFANDFIVDTGAAGDPLVGALVNPPIFTRIASSPTDTQFIFTSVGNDIFTLGKGTDIYLKAHLDSLTYDKNSNLFSGTLFGISLSGVDPSSSLFDPGLANIGSPFLQALDSLLDPNSALFDAQTTLTIAYRPDNNFFAQTDAWTISAESFITNQISTQHVPEPSTCVLVATGGFCLLIGLRLRKRQRRVGLHCD